MESDFEPARTLNKDQRLKKIEYSGYEARRAGKPKTHSFPPGSAEAMRWETGWQGADVEITRYQKDAMDTREE